MENQAQAQEAQNNVVEPQTEQQTAKMFDEAYVKQLRDEAAANRVKAKELADRLAQIEKQKQDEESLKRGEFEKLLQARDAELQKYRAENEELNSKFSAILETQRKELLSRLPKSVHEDYANATLEELQRAIKLLPPTQPAQTSPHAATNNAPNVETSAALTPEQLDELAEKNPQAARDYFNRLFSKK